MRQVLQRSSPASPASSECRSSHTSELHALRFAGGVDSNPRTYNTPTSAEVSCVVVGEGPLPLHFITIYEKSTEGSSGTTHELSYLSEHVDPLTYALLHVSGTKGYSTALQVLARDGKPHKLSMADFYAYRVMQRHKPADSVMELPLSGGRLFQQYIVDAYSKVESMRLDWIRANQKQLRVESLQGLMDHLK
eukprot:2412896-Karenia_brevis.AAC.1